MDNFTEIVYSELNNKQKKRYAQFLMLLHLGSLEGHVNDDKSLTEQEKEELNNIINKQLIRIANFYGFIIS